MQESNINELLKSASAEDLQKALDTLRSTQVVFDDVNEKGKAKATLKNFQKLLDHYSIDIKYNEMTKQCEIEIPNRQFHQDIEDNAKIGVLRSYAHLQGFPVQEIDNYVIVIGEKNSYHPVRDWIDNQMWDGKDRLPDFYNTIVLKEHNPMKEIIMRKWVLSLLAALYYKGFKCEGVLSLSGDQGIGKTTFVENLLPKEGRGKWNKDGVVIEVKNKDSMLKALSHWIAELGEIDATFRKTDIEALKNFLTDGVDVIRNPYERKSNTYQRRTVFYATVNEVMFLQDAQNRRFWVLDVEKFNNGLIDDVGQFWAQIKTMYMSVKDKVSNAIDREKNNEYGWFMSPKERQQMEPLQHRHKMDDPIEEYLEKYLEPCTTVGEYLSCTEILIECNFGRPEKRHTNIASKWLLKNGYGRRTDTKKFNVKFKSGVDQKVLNFEKFKKKGSSTF